MQQKCQICKKRVKFDYLKNTLLPIIDNKKTNHYYPCCSKECFNLWWNRNKNKEVSSVSSQG